jgi:hypothetical protein
MQMLCRSSTLGIKRQKSEASTPGSILNRLH